ncbi:hypothetical protein Angca_000003, partial [Angiostrongylus cantonensis]
MVNAEELHGINSGKDGQLARKPVPYKEISKDTCMLAILLSLFGSNTAFFIFAHFGPTLMNMAIGINIADTAFATAFPHALTVALKFIAWPLFGILTVV